jgi:diguanylate cyclase (GGDEF)-like protein
MIDLLHSLATAIDARDGGDPAHIARVRRRAAALGTALGLSDSELRSLDLAAILHDAGKLAVPAHVLLKPEALTPEEFALIRRHPEAGAAIVASTDPDAAAIVRSHHERWDGKGYPDGLAGRAIPRGARILAVADYFDALTIPRPWHTAMSREDAIQLVRAEAGKALDPEVVRVFLDRVAYDEGGGPGPCLAPFASVVNDIASTARDTEALHRIALAALSSAGVSDLAASVLRQLPSLVQMDACALFTLDAEAEELQCRFASGVDAELIRDARMKVGEGLSGWVARNRRALVNARPSADLEAAGLPLTTSLKSALATPLMSGDRCIGVLALYHVRAGFYHDEHRRLLQDACDLFGPALAQAVRWEGAMEDLLTDEVTGLPNPRFLFMHLTRELARAERLGTQVALIVMDLDGFKPMRRRYGRAVADKVLREVGTTVRAMLRPYDVCVRYQNDEFIVVLSGRGVDEAAREARAIQAAADTVWIEAGGERVPVAGSVGAAVYPDDGASFEAVLVAADGRMRADKARRGAHS